MNTEIYSQNTESIFMGCTGLEGECRRVQESAGECRRVQESAGECRRVQESAGECRREVDDGDIAE